MGWDYASQMRPPTCLLFIPRVIYEYEVMMMMMMMVPAGDNNWLDHQSFLTVLPAETSGTSRRNGQRVRIFSISIWNTSRDIQHAVKYYDMGPPPLPPIWRKVCCGFLSPLKNPSPRRGFNPRPLGPVASTLITKPPRRHCEGNFHKNKTSII
jgi:hypothetical protein